MNNMSYTINNAAAFQHPIMMQNLVQPMYFPVNPVNQPYPLNQNMGFTHIPLQMPAVHPEIQPLLTPIPSVNFSPVHQITLPLPPTQPLVYPTPSIFPPACSVSPIGGVLLPPSPQSNVMSEPSTDETKTLRTKSAVKRSICRNTKGGNPNTQKKYRWRSKQAKIMNTHEALKEKYSRVGKFVGPEEMLRGCKTVRCHVKSFLALNRIGDVLDEIFSHPEIEIRRIALPLSRKNESQNKGLIVYLQATEEKHIPIIQGIFKKHPDVTRKCELAMSKSELNAYLAAKKVKEELVDLPYEPCLLNRHSSVAA